MPLIESDLSIQDLLSSLSKDEIFLHLQFHYRLKRAVKGEKCLDTFSLQFTENDEYPIRILERLSNFADGGEKFNILRKWENEIVAEIDQRASMGTASLTDKDLQDELEAIDQIKIAIEKGRYYALSVPESIRLRFDHRFSKVATKKEKFEALQELEEEIVQELEVRALATEIAKNRRALMLFLAPLLELTFEAAGEITKFITRDSEMESARQKLKK